MTGEHRTLADALAEYRSLVRERDRLHDAVNVAVHADLNADVEDDRFGLMAAEEKIDALLRGVLFPAMYDAGCAVLFGETLYEYDPERDVIRSSEAVDAFKIPIKAKEQ